MCEDYDIIPIESIEDMIRMREKQLYLQRHDYKVWQGKSGKWFTYISEGGKRKLVKRNEQSGIEQYLYEFYKEKEENPTIEKIFYEWLHNKLDTSEITKPTRDHYICDFNRWIANTDFSKHKIKTITEEDIDILIRSIISERQITAKQFSAIRTVLNGIFKYAKRKKYTSISISTYFKDLDISKRAFRSTPLQLEGAIFRTDEIKLLLDWLYSHPTIENLGIIFAFETGVRVGELSAVKFSDVKGDVLHIQRQEIMYKSDEVGKAINEVVEYTKTEAGNRYIYLPKNSVNLLTCMRWTNKDSDFMMYKNGHRINKRMFHEYITKACKGCGIPPRSMHKIRRTYATLLIDNDVDDSLVMSQLGHTSIDTTRKYYYYANKDNESKRKQIQNAIDF